MIHFFKVITISVILLSAAQADPLPSLNLEPSATTVSGLSSGAFMAVQIQVAYSRRVTGAGIVAGGPYGCADGSAYRAVWVCMNAFFDRADAESALRDMQKLAAETRIDDVAHLATHRVYLFHGKADRTVARSSMDALRQTYAALRVPDSEITYETGIAAGHGFITEHGDLNCATTGPDFLIDCDFDQAGDILAWLYPDLSPATESRDEGVLTFDQTHYLQGAAGMGDTAFAYIPENCAAGALCRLHIVLHGCQQGREMIDDDYVRLTGYNRLPQPS
ncbi:MAG: hypothetical protein AAGF59_13015, partial [Pseudomonadota bacterium]